MSINSYKEVEAKKKGKSGAEKPRITPQNIQKISGEIKMNSSFTIPKVATDRDSNVGFYNRKGEQVNIKLKKGVHVIPSDLEGNMKIQYIEDLLKNGFIEVPGKGEVLNRSDIAESQEKEAEAKKEAEKVIYVLAHPEHKEGDEDREIKVNVIINNKKQKMKCLLKNGIIKTGQKEVYESLLKTGYNDAGTETKEDNPELWDQIFGKKGDNK